MAVKIFFCYAREDKKYLKQLIGHLSPWERDGRIRMWYDEYINAGQDCEQEIRFHMRNAQVIILLVSSKFISSDFCYSHEMIQAMERYKDGDACVIPVILRPVNWEDTPFGHLQALPKNRKPITDSSWRNQDKAFYDVAMSIDKTVRQGCGRSRLFSASDMAILATLPVPVAHYISRRVVLAALLGA